MSKPTLDVTLATADARLLRGFLGRLRVADVDLECVVAVRRAILALDASLDAPDMDDDEDAL